MEWIVEAETREDLLYGHWYGAEELVRCKDCVWCGKQYYCSYHDMYVENMDWFCADGERKR